MLEAFHFIRPAWLLALLPISGLLWLAWRQRQQSGAWQTLCDPELLPLVVEQPQQARRPGLALLGLGLLFACLALAGPSWQQLPQPVSNNDYARVFVLDLSRSMNAQDLKPSRLQRARYKLRDMLEASENARNALIVFAGAAYTVSPLTSDYRTIENQLPALATDLPPVQGGQISSAIKLAAELLQQGNAEQGEVIVLTDSKPDPAANAAATQLAALGYRLSILGIGTPNGAPIPAAGNSFIKQANGEIALATLNEPLLRELSSAGGGEYIRIRAEQSDIQRLINTDLKAINRQANEEEASRFGDRWDDAGYWLVLLLLPLALLGFRRGWLLCLSAVMLNSAPVSPSYASSSDASAASTSSSASNTTWNSLWRTPRQLGWQALENQQPEAALEHFTQPMERGVAAYRAGDYATAAEAFAAAEGAKAAYNRGNSLSQLGDYDAAIAAYQAALAADPDYDDARHNLALVEQLVEQQKQQQGQSESGEPNQEDSSQDGEQSAGENDSASDSNAGDEANGEESKEQAGDSSTEDSAEQNASAGDASDENGDEENPDEEANSQTTMGEEAADQGDKAEQKTPAQLAAEARQTQEQRQAAEQWLRRIPDDPSGLLRRKFQRQQAESAAEKRRRGLLRGNPNTSDYVGETAW